MSGSYIAGHLAAIESAYSKVIRTWQLKFELHDRSLLSTVGAVTATYGATLLNKLRWEQKRMLKERDIMVSDKTTPSYSEAQMVSLWDAKNYGMKAE